jgi:hypothetical protein
MNLITGLLFNEEEIVYYLSTKVERSISKPKISLK